MKSKNNAPAKKNWLKKLMSPQRVLTATFFVAAIVCFSFVTTAKTTYIINDGKDSVTISTFTDNTDAVIAEAGFELDSADDYTAENTTDGVNVNIKRAMTVQLVYSGETTDILTSAKNVEEFLAERSIAVDDDDMINHSMDELIYNGMRIKVDIVEVKEKVIDISTSFKTTYTDSSDIEEGTEQVVSEGVRGKTQVAYTVKYVNGQRVDFNITNTTVTAAPQNAEIKRGTGSSSASSSSSAVSTSNIYATTADTGFAYSYALNMTATAYTCDGTGLGPYTASGALAQYGIVAADTSVLPMGTTVYITSADGSWTYGYAVVGDTGVSGNVIDLYFDTYGECISFGCSSCIVYVIG